MAATRVTASPIPSGGGTAANTMDVTLNITTATNAVLVFVNGGDANPVVGAVAVDPAGANVAGALLRRQAPGGATHPAEVWLVYSGSLPTGNRTVRVTFGPAGGTNGECFVAAAEFTGGDWTALAASPASYSAGAAATLGDASLSSIPSTSGDLVVGNVAYNSTATPTEGAGQTRFRLQTTSDTAATSEKTSGSTSESMGWTGLGSSSWAVVAVSIPTPSSGPTYTLSADGGAFTLSGTDAGLRASRRIAADGGSFALTGTDASLLYSRRLAADGGAFTLTGSDASLLYHRRLLADGGAFTLTGSDVDLVYTPIDGPTYTLSAESGAFTLAGSDAALRYSRRLAADAGTFTLSGSDALLLMRRVLAANAGAFTLAGTDAALRLARRLNAESGTFTLSGSDITLTLQGRAGALILTAGITPSLALAAGLTPKLQLGAGIVPGVSLNAGMEPS